MTAVRPQNNRISPLAGAMVTAVLLAGCAVHKVKPDRRPPAELPASLAGGQADAPDRWWRSFGDAQLNSLVEAALTENFDVRRGWQRLAMLRAVADQVGAARVPQVQAGLDMQHSERTFFIGGNVIESKASQVPFSLTASYEVDLWGRVSSVRGAAATDAMASHSDLATAAMTVAARVADTWLSMVEQRAQRALLAEQMKVSQRLLQVVEGRFTQGIVSAVDVLQQRQQVAGVNAQIPLVDGAIHALENQLRALLGKTPGATLPGATVTALPDMPPLPKTGVPGDILAHRPDVRSAQLRVLANDHRVGVALAGRFPALRLSGQAGVSVINAAGDFLANPVWSMTAGLLAPIFDGGRLTAEHQRTKAALRESVLAWGQLVINALHEVDTAVARETQQRVHITALDVQLGLATQTLDETRRRYAGGVGDFLPVLTAVAAVQRLQRQRLSASRQLASHRVSVHRALGGTWMNKITERKAD